MFGFGLVLFLSLFSVCRVVFRVRRRSTNHCKRERVLIDRPQTGNVSAAKSEGGGETGPTRVEVRFEFKSLMTNGSQWDCWGNVLGSVPRFGTALLWCQEQE